MAALLEAPVPVVETHAHITLFFVKVREPLGLFYWISIGGMYLVRVEKIKFLELYGFSRLENSIGLMEKLLSDRAMERVTEMEQ